MSNQNAIPFAIASVVLAMAVPQCTSAGVLTSMFTPERRYNVDLTTEGTQDWAVWGYAGYGTSSSLVPDVRRLGANAISNLTSFSNGSPLRGIGQFGHYGQSTFQWSDGTADEWVQNALTGLQHDGQQSPATSTVGEGFGLSLPAGAHMRRAKLYVTTHYAIGRLVASLSDDSAPDRTIDVNELLTFGAPGIVELTYQADSASALLDIEWKLIESGPLGLYNSSNVAIQAASLAVVPEPASILVLVGLAGLCTRRRR